MASYSNTPVRTQISSTDTMAPSTSAVSGWVAGHCHTSTVTCIAYSCKSPPPTHHTTPHMLAFASPSSPPLPPFFLLPPLYLLPSLSLSMCMVLHQHDHDMACTTNSTVRSLNYCSTFHLTVAYMCHCTALACSVPAIRHHLGGAAGGDPDGKEADEKACKV